MAQESHNSSPKTSLDELEDKLNHSYRVMKKCFMTGKPCIFSFKTQSKVPKIFTVMQFSSNLDAFYDWSLKPFLMSFGVPEENIQRADKERGIRYIICEKICRKIQESQLVIVDLSYANPNVFYEIGLACGLGRPISFIKNKESKNLMENICIKRTLNFIRENDILDFPGVEPMLLKDYKTSFLKSVHVDYPKPSIQKKEHNISVLSFNLGKVADSTGNEDALEEHNLKEKEDIKVDFTKLVSAAVSVALRDIKNKIFEKKIKKSPMESWEEVIARKNDAEWDLFSKISEEDINCIDNTIIKGNFEQIRNIIHQSFCTIIDVSENNPIPYFWLGYCHANGINVIPVNSVSGGKKASMAFDIRALWYAEYNEKEPYKFKNIIREILEHLLEGYLSDQHRRSFWDHFPPGNSIKVFMGAIHSEEHNREVVGDWDVRAVSELFSYLPSVRPAELVTPLYSPEESWRQQHQQRNKKPSKKDKIKFINTFCSRIEEQLRDSSAIIIASPDVNPITEYVLYHAYSVRDGQNPFIKNKDEKFDGFIAVKRADPDNNKSNPAEKIDIKFDRLFYRQEDIWKKEDGNKEPPNRGFISHKDDRELPYIGSKDPLFEKYLAKNEMTEEGFFLLGHLVVTKNPVSRDYLVVLLNGVSGPATYALAQILVGGGIRAEPWMESRSEELLAKINQVLDEELGKDGNGIEAIIKVKIEKDKDYSTTYVDTRKVSNWDFLSESRYGPSPIKFR